MRWWVVHFEVGSIRSMDTYFLVSSLVLICRNLSTESIDVTKYQIDPSELDVRPEICHIAGTGFSVKMCESKDLPSDVSIIYTDCFGLFSRQKFHRIFRFLWQFDFCDSLTVVTIDDSIVTPDRHSMPQFSNKFTLLDKEDSLRYVLLICLD